MFPNDPDEPRLSDEAEELLASWPVPERAPSDWEALAAAIDRSIQVSEIGDTPDALLLAPLPDALEQERAEGRRSHPRMKRPSEGSLVRLAQASVKGAEHDAQRDAMAHSLLSQAVRARTEARSVIKRRPPRKAAEAGVHEHSAGNDKPGALPQLDVVAGLGNAVSTPGCAQPAKNRLARHERSMWFSVAFGVVGMAAAAFMYVSRAGTPAPGQAVAETTNGVREQAKASVEPAVTQAEAPATQPSLSIEDISAETERVVAHKKVALQPRTLPAKVTPPSANASVASKHETRAVPQGSVPPAAGPSENGMVMADSASTNLPDKPSTGAVQVAIGTVMEAARACVAGQQASSRASVRFGSDGRVAAVSLSGPAAGTAAGQCVKSALGGARLQPFSRPTFVVDLSIRPR